MKSRPAAFTSRGLLTAFAIFLLLAACDHAPEIAGNDRQPYQDEDKAAVDPIDQISASGTLAPERLLESLSGEIHLKTGNLIGSIELSDGRGTVFVTPPGKGNGDLMLTAVAKDAGEFDIDLVLADPNDGRTIGSLILIEEKRGLPAGTLTILGESWEVEVPVIAELEGPSTMICSPAISIPEWRATICSEKARHRRSDDALSPLPP